MDAAWMRFLASVGYLPIDTMKMPVSPSILRTPVADLAERLKAG
jgi:hypothetical protein